jgi:hypothetical protein
MSAMIFDFVQVILIFLGLLVQANKNIVKVGFHNGFQALVVGLAIGKRDD